jgi:hypothetical protein
LVKHLVGKKDWYYLIVQSCSGVFTHFHGTLPAATCDQPGKAFTAELVGAASEDEVVIMNGLSVNLVRKNNFWLDLFCSKSIFKIFLLIKGDQK